jgi:hypothetical protein
VEQGAGQNPSSPWSREGGAGGRNGMREGRSAVGSQERGAGGLGGSFYMVEIAGNLLQL